MRVGGRDRDVAAGGEFAGVLAVGFSAETDDDTGAGGLVGGVEAENSGKRARGGGVGDERGFWDTEKGGSPATGFGLVGDAADDVGTAVNFLFDAHVERHAFG